MNRRKFIGGFSAFVAMLGFGRVKAESHDVDSTYVLPYTFVNKYGNRCIKARNIFNSNDNNFQIIQVDSVFSRVSVVDNTSEISIYGYYYADKRIYCNILWDRGQECWYVSCVDSSVYKLMVRTGIII